MIYLHKDAEFADKPGLWFYHPKASSQRIGFKILIKGAGLSVAYRRRFRDFKVRFSIARGWTGTR